MTDNVENLREARARKAQDATLWTVEDALRSALRRIDAGEIKPEMVYVCFAETVADNERFFGFVSAGCSKIEALGLLSRHLHMANEAE